MLFSFACVVYLMRVNYFYGWNQPDYPGVSFLFFWIELAGADEKSRWDQGNAHWREEVGFKPLLGTPLSL